MLGYEDELYYLDTKQIINRPVERSLSIWFDKALNDGHFNPIPGISYKRNIVYMKWPEELTLTLPIGRIKLSIWFDRARKRGYFRPGIN